MKTIKAERPISPEVVFRLDEIKLELSSLNAQLEKRVDYIVQTISKVLGKTYKTWCYRDYEGEEDPLTHLTHTNSERFNIYIEFSGNEVRKFSDSILLKDGAECSVDQLPPFRWLFESFEDELIQGRKAYLEKVSQKEALDNKEKENKKKVIASIKSKLTSEELKSILFKV